MLALACTGLNLGKYSCPIQANQANRDSHEHGVPYMTERFGTVWKIITGARCVSLQH